MLRISVFHHSELLVCGSGLEVYTALQSLLAGGVDPSLITFVRPHPPSCFASRTVEEKVQRSLEESGVVLLTGHALSGVEEGGVCLTDGENTLFCSCKVRNSFSGTRFLNVNVNQM